jgi:hypothetical protein
MLAVKSCVLWTPIPEEGCPACQFTIWAHEALEVPEPFPPDPHKVRLPTVRGWFEAHGLELLQVDDSPTIAIVRKQG